MVAKIKSGKSLMGALNYNEHKVRQGKAAFIAAAGYAKDCDRLSFDDKLFRLTDLAGRNLRTKTNTLHISLNFDVSEKLETPRLIAIADDYMGRTGLGNQPYLVYEHYDAGHQHLHIVSTNIEASGKRISLHNIGKDRSEPARRAIEIAHGLVQADGKQQADESLELFRLQPVVYGKIATRLAITNIVSQVTRAYKFTSLPELNAVLNLYNVTADRGSKDSVMFKNGGLHYWVIDEKGVKQGVPLKASSIYNKPTLKLLEDRFRLNQVLRAPLKDQLAQKIGQALGKAHSKGQFKSEMNKLCVQVLFRQNAEGRIYGLTYIDGVNKAVFNGSDLGKSYSASAVMETITARARGISLRGPGYGAGDNASTALERTTSVRLQGPDLLEELLNPSFIQDPAMPYPPRPKKKKKRKNLHL